MGNEVTIFSLLMVLIVSINDGSISFDGTKVVFLDEEVSTCLLWVVGDEVWYEGVFIFVPPMS